MNAAAETSAVTSIFMAISLSDEKRRAARDMRTASAKCPVWGELPGAKEMGGSDPEAAVPDGKGWGWGVEQFRRHDREAARGRLDSEREPVERYKRLRRAAATGVRGFLRLILAMLDAQCRRFRVALARH